MEINKIVNGYEVFKDKAFKKYKKRFSDLIKEGQKPKVLFISCSDSRVVPSLITNTDPGDMFILRNVGNMVPPFSPSNEYHATAAGIEYAVTFLKISDIIVCGHSHCGAIKGLYQEMNRDDDSVVHVKKWLELGMRAKDFVSMTSPDVSMEEKLEKTEKISIVFQLLNLLTYPLVEKKVNEGSLSLRGWYYRIESGELEYYDDDTYSFKKLEGE